jgi:antiviral helicase SKI2
MCAVISTPKRPVPLEHFLYAGRDMHQVLTATGDFQEKGIKAAVESLRRKQDKEREAAGLPPVGATAVGRGGARGSVRGRGGTTFNKARGGFRTCAQQDRNLWIHLVGVLRTKKLLPVVIFTFSKRRCEEQAASMPNTDLCSAAEKSEIHVVIERSLVRLKGSDRKLPQIIRMRGLLGRGIGIHHGGMLPIVKEVRSTVLVVG